MAAAGVPVLAELTRRRCRRRSARAGEGVGGRWWTRDADRLAAGGTVGRDRGRVGVRRCRRSVTGRCSASGTWRPAAHRGADHGRPARHGLGGRRAGVFDPAPAPEGGRGGAVPAGRTHPVHARRARSTRPGKAAAGDRVRRRRHRRVPRRRGRRLLLPGDEHPPPGRAPGHRGDDRPGSGGLQFAVAAGDRLPADPPPTVGHAIEVRLYAEDPAHDWQPQTGRVLRIELERDLRTASWSHRCSGRRTSQVSPYYDAMLAKVIASAPNRTAAARRSARRARAGPGFTGGHQPRSARMDPAAPGLSCRGYRHRRSSSGMASSVPVIRRCAGCRRWRRHSRMRPARVPPVGAERLAQRGVAAAAEELPGG